MAETIVMVVLTAFTLIFAFAIINLGCTLIANLFWILQLSLRYLKLFISNTYEIAMPFLKESLRVLFVTFKYTKMGTIRIYDTISTSFVSIDKPIQCESVPIVEAHQASVNRRQLHDAIYKRLWNTKTVSAASKQKRTLILPSPKKLVIVEKTRDSKVAVNNSIVANNTIDVLANNSIAAHDSSFDKLHEELMASTYTDDSRSTFEVETLSEDTVINTTVDTKVIIPKPKKETAVVDKRDFQQFKSDVAKQAHCRWLDIFATYIGGDESATWSSKRNTTCPECGRHKKFYVVNSDTGASHCASLSCNFHCFDGFATIATFTGEKYGKVVRKIGEDVGEVVITKGTTLNAKKAFKESPPERSEMTDSEVKYLKMIMHKSTKLTTASLPYKYLISRGIPHSVIQSAANQLFGMEALSYRDNDGNTGRFPALVVPISQGLDVIGYHRIYLDLEGNKLAFEEAKKPTGNYPGAYVGSSIKLGGAKMQDGIYRVAEGVETALAVTAIEGKPCWSTMTAVGIQNFLPPENAKKVIVYADLDKSETGQLASKLLHERLKALGIECVVKLPNAAYWNKETNPKGIDFLDILNIKQKKIEETC